MARNHDLRASWTSNKAKRSGRWLRLGVMTLRFKGYAHSDSVRIFFAASLISGDGTQGLKLRPPKKGQAREVKGIAEQARGADEAELIVHACPPKEAFGSELLRTPPIFSCDSDHGAAMPCPQGFPSSGIEEKNTLRCPRVHAVFNQFGVALWWSTGAISMP